MEWNCRSEHDLRWTENSGFDEEILAEMIEKIYRKNFDVKT
mgnify:CR=1 FL=1